MFGIGATVYLFLAGVSAGLYLDSCLLGWVCRPVGRRPRELHLHYQKMQIVSIVGVIVGSLFLLADLTHPERFALVFARFGSSLLSGGSVLIVLFVGTVAFRILVEWMGEIRSSVLRGLILIVSALAAAGIIVYTGLFLMQLKAVPFWGSWLVVALFAVSSLSGGLALFSLFSAMSLRMRRLPRETRYALRCDAVLLFLELCLLAAFLVVSLNGVPAARESALELLSGGHAIAFWVLVGAGVVVPFVLALAKRSRMGLPVVVESLCVLVGCYLLRYCVMAAATRSFVLG